METLRPVLTALRFCEASQQRAYMKLLEETGCLGTIRGPAAAPLTDAQADALLDNIRFKDSEEALSWLHNVTQARWLRPNGKERCEVPDNPEIAVKRDVLLPLLTELGQTAEVRPKYRDHGHVLILGAMEGAVQDRLNTLVRLAEEGFTFGHIYLLGCQRPLKEGYEPSAGKLDQQPGGNTESGMMIAQWQAMQPSLPESLRKTPVTLIDTPNYPDGKRANTDDTIVSWLSTNPSPGKVMVVSNQPYAAYQHVAVRSVLPDVFDVETVGSAAHPAHPVGLMLDSMTREIHVGMRKLRAELTRNTLRQKLDAVHMVPIDTIDTDATTFQFRNGGDAKGETQKHHRDDPWDPLLHGQPLLLYAARDGKLEVVDGHHRLAHAKRERAHGNGPEELAARILFEHDGITRVEARAIGAYINFAQEFSPDRPPHVEQELVDAARIFHMVHAGEVREEVLPRIHINYELAKAYMAGSLILPAFGHVQRGEVPVAMAAEVAARTQVPDTQVQVMGILSNSLRGQSPARLA